MRQQLSIPKKNINPVFTKWAGLWLILGYTLLAIVLTWPTITHLTTHLPGDGGDDPAIAWNLWWVKFALLNEGQNPFQSEAMFYPIGINLAFYTLTVLNAVTALPLTLNLGVVTASNLHTLFTFVAGGYGTFLLTRYLLQTSIWPTRLNHPHLLWFSAAIAGGFYAFASSKLFYIALGQFNIGSSHWIPYTILYLVRTRHAPNRLKNSLMVGFFLTLQAWAEMTYASFLLVFIGLYWLYWLIQTVLEGKSTPHPQPLSLGERVRVRGLFKSQPPTSHLRAALLIILTFSLGLSPILAQMIPDMLREGDFLVVGGGFADAFSADLLGFLIPTRHHPVLGSLIEQTGIINYTKGQHIFIGIILLGLILVNLRAILRSSLLRFWLIATVIFALLTLGPTIIFNGQATNLPGPFVILQQLPFFKGNRYPSRYSVMLMLSLSVLAGFSLVQIGYLLRQSGAIWQGGVIGLITLLFFFEHLSLPLPQSDMRVPAPYQVIADDPADFAVLDIPFAWRNGFRITGALTTQFMFGQFYQTRHQKPMLQGNTSRNPEFKFQYFTQAPVLNSLLALQTGKTLPAERWEADRAIAAEVLHFFNIKYIVIRPDPSGNLSVTPQATIPYIEDVFPVEKIHDSPKMKIYQVMDHQESSLQAEHLMDTQNPMAPLYFGEGWGFISQGLPVAAQRQQVRLLLPLTSNPQQITLRASLPEFFEGQQTIAVRLNGWTSTPQTVPKTWTDLTFQIPVSVAEDGLNNVWLRFSQVQHSPSIQPGIPVQDVTVLSAGEEVGRFGHIFVNGHEVAPNTTGYNVALIFPAEKINAAVFNTHLHPHDSDALTYFIPPIAASQSYIAVAAADEVSLNLSEAAVHHLQQSTGARGDLRGCFRCSHAIIRTPDGQTFEALDALRPVGVTTGLGLTEPTVAAVVEWVKVEE